MPKYLTAPRGCKSLSRSQTWGSPGCCLSWSDSSWSTWGVARPFTGVEGNPLSWAIKFKLTKVMWTESKPWRAFLMYSHLRQGRSGGRVDWGWVPTSITWGLTSCRLQSKAFFRQRLIIKLLFSISHLGCNLNRQELHHPHNRIRGQVFGQGMVGLGHPNTRVMTVNQM